MKLAFSNLARAISCGLLVSLAACGGGSGTSASVSPSAGATDVAVSGNQLTRGGVQWIPHGFYQIAFEVPPAELPNQQAFWTIAQQNYTAGEYTQMKQLGADSVRIQVAQTGMDPDNTTFFSATFRDEVLGAIKAARAAGLTVIVSVQDEQQTGDLPQDTALPSDATQRVWQTIAPAFATDRGVLFELFNEPHIGKQATVPFPTPDWSTWAAAMNRTIQTIRSAGAQNVVIADGLQFAQELSGAPTLADPLHQVAYAAHPYSLGPGDQSSAVWDEKFGRFAATQPVIISEWGIGYYCDPATPQVTVDFLQYLQVHGIGMEAGAWDWASAGFGSAMYDFPVVPAKVSSFLTPSGTKSACKVNATDNGYIPGFGFGKLIQTWYQTGTPASAVQ